MDRLHVALSESQLTALRRWLLRRQDAGFTGRPNKDADTCYSFWVGAALEVRSFLNYFFSSFSCMIYYFFMMVLLRCSFRTWRKSHGQYFTKVFDMAIIVKSFFISCFVRKTSYFFLHSYL